MESPIGALVFVALIIAAWIAIARHNRHWRAVKEAERQAAWAQYQQEQWAQQQRHAAEQAWQAAERERQAQVAAAERDRLRQHEEAERQRLRHEHWEQLKSQWGEADAKKIWTGRPWVGCTSAMLIATLGYPEDIDTKVLKTKTKDTYKYRHRGGNRYGLRVVLDDGVVTGWEDKD